MQISRENLALNYLLYYSEARTNLPLVFIISLAATRKDLLILPFNYVKNIKLLLYLPLYKRTY